jgi:hypothetical protein
LVSRHSQRGCTIMAMDGARKLVGGVVSVVTGAAKHAVWYVRYQVEGVTRDDTPQQEDGPPDRRA